jgi:subtilisin family serine protease
VAACCILAAVSAAAATDVPPADRGSQLPAFVPGELLVKFRPEVRQEAAAAYQYWFDMTTRRTFVINGYQQVRLPEGTDVEEALELYLEDPDVEHAEPNYIVSADITPPDDTYFNRLWGLHNTGQNVNGTNGTHDADIDALAAWDVTTGSADVLVAVIDTGVDVNHPDLQANIWINTGEIADNGVDDDRNGYTDDVTGWDFLWSDNDPRDANGHGTHVAGTIAAVGDNNTGVTGVSWSAQIMPLRFLDAWGLGSTANAIAAIEYANRMGADIINNSWGGSGYVQALEDAIEASDALVVCAAGNSGRNNDNIPHYPSSYASANIIAVAATNQDDQLAWFSNYGADSVDVAAPGTHIYSAAPGRETLWQDNFDDGNIDGWTTGGTNNSWDVTSEEAFSGSYALTDSPNTNYANNTDSWAHTPVLKLTDQTASKLEFKILDTVDGSDTLWIEASANASSWQPVSFQLLGDRTLYNGVSGTFESWTTIEANLEAYDGRGSVYIRFHFTSDSSKVADGFYIDDVKITAASTVYSGTEYTYKQGTSMATPHVTGLAALIIAQNPALNNLQVKALIEDNVDSKPDLIGKVATNGRINAGTALADPPSIVPFPSIDFAADVITVIYDEEDMLGANTENHYSFSPSMNFSTVDPNNDDITHLGGSMYQLSMASIPAYEVFTLTVSGITDLMGNAVTPASITINDDDSDDMADHWETEYGLDPDVDDSAADADDDGYSNIEEYEARTHPRSSAEAPFVIQDTIPEHNAGISDGQRVPHNTTVAVFIESANGIDMTDDSSVKFTIIDGIFPDYTRNLAHSTVRWIKLTTDPDTRVTRMWVVYDRSQETGDLQNFPYDSNVNVKVDATDYTAYDMVQASFNFHVETEAQSDEAWALENLPDSNTVAADDPDLGGVLDDGIEVISGELTGAKILFNSSELQTPLFGPMNEIPPVSDADGVGIPMNLQPPAVFDNPVKILIPCPGYDDVSGLFVHYYDGNSWILAVDAAGNVQPGGEGLVVPGSRINHNDTDPPTIEIRIFHFSGFQAAVAASFSSVSGDGGGGGGGGCFISTASSNPVLRHLIAYALFTFALASIGIYAFNKIMRKR